MREGEAHPELGCFQRERWTGCNCSKASIDNIREEKRLATCHTASQPQEFCEVLAHRRCIGFKNWPAYDTNVVRIPAIVGVHSELLSPNWLSRPVPLLDGQKRGEPAFRSLRYTNRPYDL